MATTECLGRMFLGFSAPKGTCINADTDSESLEVFLEAGSGDKFMTAVLRQVLEYEAFVFIDKLLRSVSINKHGQS